MDPKIAVITAIYGNYESTCKAFAKQSVPCDFICFTDNPEIQNNDWVIDTTPYHLQHTPFEGSYINSIDNNKHTFNMAKYYKQSFINIPRLQKYDCIVWVDGTIAITSKDMARYILSKIYTHKIVAWAHHRKGVLMSEVKASMNPACGRYCVTKWFNQTQPYQDVMAQYDAYKSQGYTHEYFNDQRKMNREAGLWCTCFIAFLKGDDEVVKFLNHWYLQTLTYTTQDQIGFPFSVQKCGMVPLTLPNKEVRGNHDKNDHFIKNPHHM